MWAWWQEVIHVCTTHVHWCFLVAALVATLGDFSLAVLFENRVSISMVKSLGLTFIGCTWPWIFSLLKTLFGEFEFSPR